MNKKRSDKNKLVKFYLEHEKQGNYKKALGMKEHGRGVYILYKKDKVYYIGLSKRSIRGRIRKHLKDKHRGKWDNFSFFQIRRPKYVKDIETLLIRIFNPAGKAGNRVNGRFRKKYDLSR